MNKIIQWNCRGYRKRYLDIQALLLQEQPLCLSIQETMLGNHSPNPMQNYQTETMSPTPLPIPGNGLAILIRKDSGYKRLNLNCTLQAMAVQLNFSSILLTVCNIYIPPGEILHMRDLLELVDELPRPCMIGGDFNAKHTLWGNTHTDQRGRIIENLLIQTDLCLMNTLAQTHFHVQTGTTSAIDLTFASPDLSPELQWSTIDDLYGSDHFPILTKSLMPAPHIAEPRYILRRADWSSFEALTAMEEPNIDASVEELKERFMTTIKTAASISIPRSKGGPVKHNVPWWNTDCELAKAERKRSLRRYQRTRLMIDKISYNRARAIAQMTNLLARKESWRKYVSSLNSDTPLNKIWKRVNKMKNKHRPGLPCLVVHGVTIADPEDVANALAESFEDVSSGRHYPPRFMPVRDRLLGNMPDFSTREHHAYNDSLTMLELCNALTLGKNSAPGPDEISYQMLKHLHPSALKNLLALFNRVYHSHQIPRDWRQATILAFPKPGKDRLRCTSYRPIALTSCVGKLMEKMINIRLMRYLESQSLINRSQYGFRQGRGTTDSLIRVHNHLKKNMSERKHSICVFFDIEKAYDTTWRAGILAALHEAGIRGNLGSYLKEFLCDRRFRVKIGNTYSTEKTQIEGVPQGSVISCTLFLMALNGIISDLPVDVHASLYVDDLMLYASSRHLPSLGRRLQRAINTIENWATRHGFKFSPLKTTAVHFNPSRSRVQPPNLTLAMHDISYSNQANFLGMTFDHKLSWETHIKNLKATCTRKLDLLKCLSKLNWGSDRSTLLHLYRSLIRSKLDYGCIIYQSAKKNILTSLNPVHNSAIRLCTGAFRTSPIHSLLAESGEPPLEIRRIQLTLQYLARLHQLPESPTFESVLPDYLPDGVPNYVVPSSIDFIDVIRTMDVTIYEVIPITFNNCPTWHTPISTFCNGAAYPKKSETHPTLLKSIFLDHLNTAHSNTVHIYTDGSKNGGDVGCAATCIYGTVSKRLHPSTSVFSAELYAIIEALRMIERLPHISFTIFSDSQSAVSASRQYYSCHPLLSIIATKLAQLQDTYKTVKMCWLPSHVDIRGNDDADEAARAASQRNEPPDNRGVPCRDHYPAIKRAVLSLWQREWSEVNNNKLRNIKDTVKPWISSCNRDRRFEVALCRLRIGHTRLTHRYLIERLPQQLCNNCNVHLTILHIMAECPRFSMVRQNVYPSLQLAHDPVEKLKMMLSDTDQFKFNAARLKSFLNGCGIYKEL